MHTHLRTITTHLVLGLGAAALLAGCGTTERQGLAPALSVPDCVEDMSEAHNATAWWQFGTVEYTTEVDFRGLPYRSHTVLGLGDWSISETASEPTSFTMRAAGGLEEVLPGGELPEGFNVEAMIYRWPYFFAAPFVLAEETSGMEYLGPVLIEDRLYDAVWIEPDTGDSTCPCDWMIAYITSAGNEMGTGYLAMLRYPVTYPTGENRVVAAEHVAVYEPLEGVPTSAGEVIVPGTITFHPWQGTLEVDGPEGMPALDETLGTATFHLQNAY
jgi:hypothetical protein